MKANTGTMDRLIRAIVGLALLVFFFVGDGDMRYLGLIGIVPLLTAVIGYCPLYGLLGMSTCPADADKKKT